MHFAQFKSFRSGILLIKLKQSKAKAEYLNLMRKSNNASSINPRLTNTNNKALGSTKR